MIKKELLVSDFDDFIEFVKTKGWEVSEDYETILTKHDRVKHFLKTDKWVHFDESAYPLVVAYKIWRG